VKHSLGIRNKNVHLRTSANLCVAHSIRTYIIQCYGCTFTCMLLLATLKVFFISSSSFFHLSQNNCFPSERYQNVGTPKNSWPLSCCRKGLSSMVVTPRLSALTWLLLLLLEPVDPLEARSPCPVPVCPFGPVVCWLPAFPFEPFCWFKRSCFLNFARLFWNQTCDWVEKIC